MLVWDAPTRLFHWLVIVLAPYATSRLNWMDWHVRIGETLPALMLFRLLWCFVGSETARFHRARPLLHSSICATCSAAKPTCRSATIRRAGGWMVLLLLALLLDMGCRG